MRASSQICRRSVTYCLFLLRSLKGWAGSAKLVPPAEDPANLDKIYSFDLDGARDAAKRMQQGHPTHPLGYLLEAEALWWRIWCTSAEFKYGMTDARRRPKREPDQHYLKLAATASSLATAKLQHGA